MTPGDSEADAQDPAYTGTDAPFDTPPPEVTLVGVGHVFDLRVPLRALIRDRRPDLVLVELDRRRYAALTAGGGEANEGALVEQRPGGVYGILARFQQKAARSLGTTPGEEMVVAVEAAREAGARAGLIDMDAQVAFARMWQEMGWREKLRFLWASLRALFASEERIEEEVEGLSGDYTDLMEAFAAEFPSAKRVLLDERDELMAHRVREQAGSLGAGGRLIVVVGDGHVEGMADRLADLGPSVVRLRELLEEGSGPGPASATTEATASDTASVGFSVRVRQDEPSASDGEEE